MIDLGLKLGNYEVTDDVFVAVKALFIISRIKKHESETFSYYEIRYTKLFVTSKHVSK